MRLIPFALLVTSVYAQVFPANIVTDKELLRLGNRVQTSLLVGITASDTQATVASASQIQTDMALTVDNEIVHVCGIVGTTIKFGVSSCPNIDGRGVDGSVAANHSASISKANIFGNFIRQHHLAMTSEIKAIEAALGRNLQLATADPVSTRYAFAALSPGGTLAAGLNTITVSPVPAGVSGTDLGHRLYVSGGTGAAEACLISGGTAVSGASTGTLILSCGNTHSGAWTLQSATAGIQEGLNVATAGGKPGKVVVPSGWHTTYATVTITGNGAAIQGAGILSTRIIPSFTGGDVFLMDGTNSPGGVGTANSISDMNISNSGLASVSRVGVHIDNQNTACVNRMYIQYVTKGIQITGGVTFMPRIVQVSINALQGTPSQVYGIEASGAGEYRIIDYYAEAAPGTATAAIGLHAGGAYVTDCDVIGFGYGLLIDPGAGQIVQYSEVKNGVFDTCDNSCIEIAPKTGGLAQSSHFIDSWSSSAQQYGFHVSTAAGGLVRGVEVLGHRSYNNAKHGYFIEGGDNISIGPGSRAAGNSAPPSAAGSYDGIAIGSGVNGFRIFGAWTGGIDNFSIFQRYGINVVGPTNDSYSITNNKFGVNLTANIHDSGTGVQKILALNDGVDNGIGFPAIASAASITLPTTGSSNFAITGTTAVKTILGGRAGQTITLVFTDAAPAGVSNVGGNIAVTRPAVTLDAIRLTFDGSYWY